MASALVARGHEVRFLSGAEHRELATAHGCTFELLPRLGPTPRDGDLGFRIWGRGADMAVPLAAALRSWGPELFVVDLLTRCGAFAAQLLGVPWVEVCPHHLPDPAPDLPPVGLGRVPARSPWRRADDRRLSAAQQRSFEQGQEQAAQAAATIGLAEVAEPELRLLATLPSLERPRSQWPGTAHVVGSLAIEPPIPPLEPPAGTDPLVLVTDSTATGVDRSLATVAIDALRHLDVRLVVTSSRLPPTRQPRVVVGRGPHGPLLAEAAVAVSPGGGGFVSKAAQAGVPHVVVPLLGDQREAAARLRDAGAGRGLLPRAVLPGWLPPRRLRWAIVRMLADRDARAASARLAEESSHLGPGLAASLIEAFLAGSRPIATGPAHHLRRDEPRAAPRCHRGSLR